MTKEEYIYGVGILKGKGEFVGDRRRLLEITPEYLQGIDKHTYTPDFKTKLGERDVYHEVKGDYAFESQDGAKLRFLFAAINNPEAIFVWATKRKVGWDIAIYYDGARTKVARHGVQGFTFNEKGGVIWEESRLAQVSKGKGQTRSKSPRKYTPTRFSKAIRAGKRTN